MHFGDYISGFLVAASSFTQSIFSNPSQPPSEQNWPGKKVDYYARNLKTITSIYNLTVYPSKIYETLHLPVPVPSPLFTLAYKTM